MDERTSDGQPSGSDTFAAPATQRSFMPEPVAAHAHASPDPTPAYAAPAPSAPTVPAGWYPDPANPAVGRWWDGSAWTEHRTAPTHQGGGAATPMTAAPPKRRSLLKVALGTLAVLIVLGVVGSGALRAVTAAMGPSDPGDVQFEIVEPVPASWTSLDVMGGAASLARDPAWVSIDDALNLTALTEEANSQSRYSFTVDGAWMSVGDMMAGGETITVISTTELTGAEGIREFSEGAFDSASAEFTGVEQSDAGVFETSTGQQGYVIRFVGEFYGTPIDGAIGVMASSDGYVLVQHIGSDGVDPGQAEFDAMLNSLAVE